MSAFIDLTGRRFGRLLVMQATSKRSSQGDMRKLLIWLQRIL